jgi:hypothetical protein
MKIHINGSEYDISSQSVLNVLLDIEKTQKNLSSLLSSSPKKLQNIKIPDSILHKLCEISEIGSLDIGEENGEWYITIRWLTDVTDWFIGHTLPMIGKGNNFEKAFNDFYYKLSHCPDRVIQDEEWHTSFSYNKKEHKFVPHHKTVWLNVYKKECKEQLELIEKKSGFSPYVLKEKEWYVAKNPVLYMDKKGEKKLIWKGSSPKEAIDDMVKQMREGKTYLVNGPVVEEIKI